MADIKIITKNLINLTTKEMRNIAKILKEDYDIEVPTLNTVISIRISEIKKEEPKSTFNIMLKDVGVSTLRTLKVIKELYHIGLAEAKAIVDEAPTTIQIDLSKQDAEKIKFALMREGAVVEIV